MDFLPQPLLRRLAFKDFQRCSKHSGLCRDTRLLPQTFNLLFLFLGDRYGSHYGFLILYIINCIIESAYRLTFFLYGLR